MVRALLDGKKTQTRRLIKVQPGNVLWGSNGLEWSWLSEHDDPPQFIRCPFGVPGDHLWVKETHQAHWTSEVEPARNFVQSQGDRWTVRYCATDDVIDIHNEEKGTVGPTCRPSIFMPRWASRITLEVTEVRVQRLHDISQDDAEAEGITCTKAPPIPTYAHLWNEINGAGAWAKNPWVWAISFKRVSP